MTNKIVIALLSIIISLMLSTTTFSVEPDEVLDDPKLEERARKLSTEFRCLVCQNQSIDDSDAQLAKDLRLLVRERLAKGDNDTEVKKYLVERYGEFVLLKPVIELHTYLLWFGPFLILLIAFYVLWNLFKKREMKINENADLNRKDDNNIETKPSKLTAEEEKELSNILKNYQ